MFDLPEGKLIEPDAVKTKYKVGDVEDCEEIQYMYLCIAELIDASDESDVRDTWMKTTLKAHREMIESRNDWDMCQKTVRRRRVISMWHNTQVLKENAEDKPE